MPPLKTHVERGVQTEHTVVQKIISQATLLD